MGFFDFLKKEKPREGFVYAPTQSGGIPFYSDFGSNIYASDIIVQSIRCKANEFKKLKPRHIRGAGSSQNVITDSSVAKVLACPNDYMTTADFLEKIAILLELNKNVFIYPSYYINKAGEKVFTGLYPLKPATVEYLSDDKGELFIGMSFNNGEERIFKKSDIIHWRKDYGVNDYFGGGMCGGNDDAGLLQMLKRYDMLLQSLSKSLECSCQINGVVKLNSYLADEKLETSREKFEQDLKDNKSGLLFTDQKIEYTALPRDIKIIDAETLKAVYEMILRSNGTSIAILNGDYTKAQKEAYYEHALEADIISLGQAMSKCLFSDRETAYKNEVVLYPSDILFMSMENKLAYMNLAVPAGAMSINQILAFGGLPPVEGGDDIRPRGYNELDGGENNGKQTE